MISCKYKFFFAQCVINKVSKLVNIVSRALVNHLKLLTKPYPNSYNWLEQLSCSYFCWEILSGFCCDVMDTDACQILLGESIAT